MRLLLCGLAALLASFVAPSAADAGGLGRARAVCIGGNCGTGVSVNVGLPVLSRNVVVQSVPQVLVQTPVIQERVQVNVDVPLRNRIIVRRGLFGRTIIRRGCR